MQLVRQETEIARTSNTAGAIEEIRAAITIARSFPRSVEVARSRLLDAAKRPAFAEVAMYHLPFGGGVSGPSIRMAEEVLRAWTNVHVGLRFERFAEDPNGYGVEIWTVSVVDLESNTRVDEPMMVPLTAERKSSRGNVVGSRTTADGQKRFIVALSESEVRRERGKARSIARRNAIFTLVPRDLIDEACAAVQATRRSNASDDPRATARKLFDRLREAYGVDADDLAEVLGCALDKVGPDEIQAIYGIGTALKEGATWRSLYRQWKAEQQTEVTAVEQQAPGEPRGAFDGVTPGDNEQF